jgi:hypothetical protein
MRTNHGTQIQIEDNVTVEGNLNVVSAMEVQGGGVPDTGYVWFYKNIIRRGAAVNVTQSIENTQLNGFTSLYFSTISGSSANEKAQLFCGQASGLNVCTNTAHPIAFRTYIDQPGSTTLTNTSMQILGTGTRDVEILAPLKIKCLQTTIENGVIIGGSQPVESNGLFVSNNAIINRNLTVNGNLTVEGTTSFANPYWVAVVINFVGGVPTIVRNGGRNAATSLLRVSGQAIGIVQFDFPAHPQGTNYVVSATAVAGYGTILTSVRSSTRIGISMRNTANQLFDTEAHVLIVAY